ncbi:AbiH family protein [Flavobacterium algoritolerans]|uniref:AbiH family protein n=1 Tax=Flavobacterium algoritolerans TaxID=3041254 RepID=A0ABT6V6R2_9FLAO|nr:AbiH family protein [Flavobacterium algoritolerans]MDI5893920.1 AbiH family protein [Flavobacterium algoritolerans]
MRKAFVNMNRLVIIGNGFDLAHGLPTSYKDFIDDYWINVLKELYNNHSYSDSLFVSNISRIGNDYNAKSDWQKSVCNFETLKYFISRYERYCTLEFTNNFFLNINNQINIEKWVDIENLYYNQLKIITKHGSLKSNEKKQQVVLLNKEFEQVKKLLEKYLKEKVVDSFNVGVIKDSDYDQFKFCDILRPISIPNEELNLDKEFSNDDFKEIENQLETRKIEGSKGLLRILNFNYTPTALRYLRAQNLNDDLAKIHIAIHGIIGNENEHKINFGFGDEMDEDYKIIENLDDNEYLKNFKSFQYLQNSNYKNLLDFIDANKFQVLIMGHSCGLSDRTLLNTVFEHNNCRSIKVFYHETEDENGKVIKDNYTEIIQNISRHFNKKKLMREKIVNKTLCQPLPQIQLPLK